MKTFINGANVLSDIFIFKDNLSQEMMKLS